MGQLEALNLEKILEDLTRTRDEGQTEVKKLESALVILERDIGEATTIFDRATTEHTAVSAECGTKKEDILAKIEESRRGIKEHEAAIEKSRQKMEALEDKSWSMNTKYAEKMEQLL